MEWLVTKSQVKYLLVFGIILFIPKHLFSQSVSFDIKSSPNVEFKFHTVGEYQNGIIIPNALELKVNVTGSQWDLYVGTTTTAAGSWNAVNTYSSGGAPPTVDMLQARVYNSNGTSQTGGGFFPLTDLSSPTYVIGSNFNNVGINCSDPIPVGTNVPGDYTTSPGCYKFRVDLKITPGFNYRPGLYTLRVDYILIEDL
jgi:hypothetical protein